MAIARVASTGLGSSDGNTVTTNAINTTGATLIIAGVGLTLQTAASFSDSAGNTWTNLTQYNESGRGSLQGWCCLNPTTSSAHTFTATLTSGRPSLVVAAYSGVAALDAQSGLGAAAAALSIQPGSITPAGNDELFVTCFTKYGSQNTGLAVDSSFTIEQNIVRTATAEATALADLIQTTGTAENPTWSWSISDYTAVNMAVFTASGGGGFTAKQRRTLSPLGARVGSRQAQAT